MSAVNYDGMMNPKVTKRLKLLSKILMVYNQLKFSKQISQSLSLLAITIII